MYCYRVLVYAYFFRPSHKEYCKMKFSHLVLLISLFSLSLVSYDTSAKKGLRFGKGLRGITTKTYDQNTLSQTQLITCLQNEKQIDESAGFIEQEKQSVSDFTDEIEALDKQLDKLARDIESTVTSSLIVQNQIDEYNEKIDKYNLLLQKRNTKFEGYSDTEVAFNSQVNQHNELIKQFSLQCAGKRYYEDDMELAEQWVTIKG